MENIETMIRMRAAYAEDLRAEADRARRLRAGRTARPGPRATFARWLRGAAERLDPVASAPRPRSA